METGIRYVCTYLYSIFSYDKKESKTLIYINFNRLLSIDFK